MKVPIIDQKTNKRLNVNLMEFKDQVTLFDAQEVIFWEGDPATHFYILLEGTVHIYRNRADGSKILLAELGPGEFFGEMALMQHTPRTGSAVAYYKSRVLALSENQLVTLIAADAWFGLKMIKVLTERLKKMGDTLVQI